MSQSEFARLLGVSAASIGNWERTKGRLHLQARTRDALRAAGRLTIEEAWQRLDGA
jgi:DNA-binding transcriptional regulator YiaG